MNVCFYTDFFISGMTGGIGRVTSALTDYFRNHFEWKVYSIYAFMPKADCLLTEVDGSIQLRLHNRIGLRNLRSNYEKAARFITEHNIETVIVQTSMDVVAKLRNTLERDGIRGVKVISVLHYTPGTDLFPISLSELAAEWKKGNRSPKIALKAFCAPFFNWWEHKCTVRAYRQAYQYGDKTILLSQSYIPRYKKFAGLNEDSKLTAISNPVPFEETVSEEDLQKKQHTALVVGRMTDYPKRISVILDIWNKIEKVEEVLDWTLEIVGEGPDLEKFKAQAKNLGLKRVLFVGRQNPIDFYRRASLFLMTSEFEGFPMTLVEAQQMGCVPIAYDSFDSLYEVITNDRNGCIIKHNDESAFVCSLLTLMRDRDQRTTMARNNLSDCKRYSQQMICSQWKYLIESLRKDNEHTTKVEANVTL